MRLLKFTDILNCMFASYKAEILIRLLAQIFQNNLNLILSTNYMVLFVISLLLFFLFILVFYARRQREARVTLEEVSLFLEFFFVFGVAIILIVDKKFIDNTTKTPQIRRLVIRLLHQRDLGRSVPPGPNMKRHDSFHFFASGSILYELFTYVLLFDVFQFPNFRLASSSHFNVHSIQG